MLKVLADFGVASVGLFAAAEIPTDSLLEIATKYGAAGVVVAWFLWRDHQRAKRADELLDERNAYEREELADMNKRSAAAMDRLSRAVDGCPKRGKDSQSDLPKV